MTQAAPLAEIWRGPFLESVHAGHAVICDGTGQIVSAWGNPDAVVLPRSSSKMLQALPLVTSGAADTAGLGAEHLALACASHQGAPRHVDRVNQWLSDLGLTDNALQCGPQESRDADLRIDMIRAKKSPCRVHNNCSGKHAGFLTLAHHLEAGPDYVAPDHPVQTACRDAFETVTGMDSPGFGIDGCSAPNFATTMHGMARAMGWFATAGQRSDRLSKAATRLTEAMYTHPDLVAGDGRACTRLMRASQNPIALKTGAEGYFIAILPRHGLGIAVKAADGATRAAECAIAALLVRLKVLHPAHPDVAAFLNPAIVNWDGLVTGEIKPAPGLMA
ncbi:asparaginase [Marivita sp. S0852]|uniref:asparaginase n=1 Tax=Marivita sp. S0852 TaxID=3373893 RepID=UPI0039825A0B